MSARAGPPGFTAPMAAWRGRKLEVGHRLLGQALRRPQEPAGEEHGVQRGASGTVAATPAAASAASAASRSPRSTSARTSVATARARLSRARVERCARRALGLPQASARRRRCRSAWRLAARASAAGDPARRAALATEPRTRAAAASRSVRTSVRPTLKTALACGPSSRSRRPPAQATSASVAVPSAGWPAVSAASRALVASSTRAAGSSRGRARAAARRRSEA